MNVISLWALISIGGFYRSSHFCRMQMQKDNIIFKFHKMSNPFKIHFHEPSCLIQFWPIQFQLRHQYDQFYLNRKSTQKYLLVTISCSFNQFSHFFFSILLAKI